MTAGAPRLSVHPLGGGEQQPEHSLLQGLEGASWARIPQAGRENQSELPCTSPPAGPHCKFYFLVNARREVPCVDGIPLLVSRPAFKKILMNSLRKNILREAGLTECLLVEGGFTNSQESCQRAVEGWAGCACAAPSWNQLLFPGTATSL